MQLRESTVARLGLIALALVEWRHAALLVWNGLMPLHPFAIGIVLTLYLTSFALVLQAIAKKEPTAASTAWAVAPMLLVFLAFGYQDAVHKQLADIYPTTDAHAYMDVAARLLVQGKNPYAESLLEGFRIFRLPMRFATPLLDGDFSDRVAYPSLSFVALVPLVLLKIPTYLAYAAAFVATLFVITRRAPWWARGLVFAFFLHDETFAMMTFGGVTDSLWTLCLVGAVVWWDRRVLAAVLVGLACAQKQHPWFFVPYLLIRICREENVRPWQGAALRFVAIVAGVFVALNLPFALWGPKAWIIGLVEPLIAPMVQLSEGLTALGMTGYVRVPKPITSLVFWGLYAYSLAVYARHTSKLKHWCWFVPAVVLWFGYRALMSYWYFNALLAVAALVAPVGPEIEDENRSPTWSARIGFGFAAVVSLLLVVFADRKEPFDVTVLGPIDTWETHVFRLRVRVTNLTKRTTKPRFVVQGSGLQPMQWTVDVGWLIEPGKTADFLIRAPKPFNGFEINSGARLAIVDGGGDGDRTYRTVHGNESVMRFDAVPNGDFTYFDTRVGAPYGWAFTTSDSAARLQLPEDLSGQVRATLVFDPKPEAEAAAAPAGCYNFQLLDKKPRLEAMRSADLATTIDMPLDELAIRVNVPKNANRPPWNELYGLHLAVPNWDGYVLFGASEARGTLPSGAPFVSIAAPHEQWTTLDITMPRLLADLAAPSELLRFSYTRFPDLDVPASPVQIGLFATVPGESTGQVAFGAIVAKTSGLHENELVARGIASGPGREAWRSERELENDNLRHATALIEHAVAQEPTFDRLRLLGDIQLRGGQPVKARDAYQRALEIRSTGPVEKGLGWSLVHTGDPAGAIAHLQRARDLFAASETLRPRPSYSDALNGLIVAYAKLGKCTEARATAAAVREENSLFPPPAPEECFP